MGYYTHWQDANLTLLQLGVRFYDPEIGRFGQTDILGENTESGYVYCANNPTDSADPSGYAKQDKKDDKKRDRRKKGKPDDLRKAEELVKSTVRRLLYMIINACGGRDKFPIGKLLGELEKIRKMAPKARDKVREECQPLVDEANSDDDCCGTKDIWLYVNCNRCCYALVDYLGYSHLSQLLCGPLCKKLLK